MSCVIINIGVNGIPYDVKLNAHSHIACRAHAMPMPCPCRATKSLECVFPIWFTQCGRVWFTLAMPCSDHAVLLKATAQHVRRETVCGLPTRVRLLPATTRSSTKIIIRSIPISDAGGHCETKQCFSWTRKRMVAAHYKKKKNLLHCWTHSSDISGYHADFHEGYQKHTNLRCWRPVWNQTTFVMDDEKSGSSTLRGGGSALLNCWTSSSDISGYRAEFHEGCYQKHTNLRCRWPV